MRAPKVVVAAVAVAALTGLAGLAGCSGDSDDTPSTPTTEAATTNADGTTVAGTELAVGKHAVVGVKADKKHSSLVKLTVTKVKKGKVKDLDRFQLSSAARKSTVYYVSTKVKNLGPDALSGAKITLYGKVSDKLVVPPVVLRSSFPTCNYTALPKKFTKGKSTKGCMVMLAPKHGKVSEIQWRPADDSEPVAWKVH